MAKSAHSTKMAELNTPNPQAPEGRGSIPPERRTVTPTPDDVKAQADSDDDSVADAARKAAAEQTRAAKDAAAARASDQAARLRDAGESFDPGSFAHAASERLADNLSDAARSIRDTDLTHVADDLASFARRQPLLFFGGAALLGFAAGRMLKASERADTDTTGLSPHDRGVS
ncbi:hypothetical protein roselon_02823 [Roseibacterium elongatum DSM 19469]|uniref:Uncharacterized protein n=1 Tax=Roseicyclus elongatus DSM 19469 TaxID=1294273 RepID=W8S846_9RHOB|nr:hypothetical protein [Roseibacterium elongatum]AHM05121.1 hypothetical protein roselon_02823 [Roseibacterium elongatum DSM 19469]